MSKIVYVPQGRSARLIFNHQSDIQGLCTDQFSTCNILLGISHDHMRLILIHIDYQARHSYQEIFQEINWLKGESSCSLSLFYRTNGHNALIHDMDQILSHLDKVNISIKKIQLHQEYDGLYGYFPQDVPLAIQQQHAVNTAMLPENDVPYISALPIGLRLVDELIHHPNEQSFMAVRKIEQIVGLRAEKLGSPLRKVQLCIFDGTHWEALNNNELSVDTTHRATQEELQKIKPAAGKSFSDILGKFSGLMEHLFKQFSIQISGNANDIASAITPYVESYTNQFKNKDRILQINLEELHDFYTAPSRQYERSVCQPIPLSKKEIQTLRQLNTILKQHKGNAENLYIDVKNLLSTTESAGNSIVHECKVFTGHYNQRAYYDGLSQTRVEGIGRIIQLIREKGAEGVSAEEKKTALQKLAYYATKNHSLFLRISELPEIAESPRPGM